VFERLLYWLQTASRFEAGMIFLAQNLLILCLVIFFGNWLAQRYRFRPVTLPPPPLTKTELAAAAGNVLLNTVITFVGWQLWLRGVIRFRSDAGLGAVADVIILLFTMDLLMYGLHRVAHLPLLFPLVHRFHHRYEQVRPLTLFALNPFENLAFGALWLTVISIYSTSWAGMSVYLMLNVAFGAIGHLGVEPVPGEWARKPLLRCIAGSSFHAQHHQEAGHNYGFYTLIWDRLFGTLQPDYAQNYGQVPEQ
jgi:sterol desaturase/sphingolipid hydroxylase (fatty acid hydroxylase superfamily)